MVVSTPTGLIHNDACSGCDDASVGDVSGNRRGEAFGTYGAYGVPAHELPDRQRALELLKAELGAERYAEAIARGAAMSYDEALDSTTRALDSLMTS